MGIVQNCNFWLIPGFLMHSHICTNQTTEPSPSSTSTSFPLIQTQTKYHYNGENHFVFKIWRKKPWPHSISSLCSCWHILCLTHTSRHPQPAPSFQFIPSPSPSWLKIRKLPHQPSSHQQYTLSCSTCSNIAKNMHTVCFKPATANRNRWKNEVKTTKSASNELDNLQDNATCKTISLFLSLSGEKGWFFMYSQSTPDNRAQLAPETPASFNQCILTVA